MLKKITSWSAVILWTLQIYSFSAQPAEESARLSRGFSKFLCNFVEIVIPQEITMQSFHSFLRSGAHFFIYFVLALLLINAFKVSGYNKRKTIIYSIASALLIAIADELNQLFMPGRAAQLKDVFLDSLGILTAVLLYLLLDKFVLSKSNH